MSKITKLLASQDSVLKDVPNTAETFTVNANIETIYGVNDKIYCFKNAKDTIQNVNFEPNSKLSNINPYAFFQCSKLSSIDLSPCTKLRIIGDYAFQSCSLLSSIVLPEGLQTIGEYSLSYLSIHSITIPASVQTINQLCFIGNSKLENVIFSPGSQYKSIDWNTFCECNLQRFEVPESVSGMTGVAFQKNPRLSEITVNPKNTRMISDGIAIYSSDYTILYFVVPARSGTFNVKQGVATLSQGSFFQSSLSSINLPNSLKTIAGWCFYNSKIKSIIIPNSVTDIGTQSFMYCYELKHVDLSSSMTTLQFDLFAKSGITSIVIPDSVTTIQSQVFAYCASLTAVTLPASLKELGGNVIYQSPAKLEFAPGSIYYLKDQKFILDKTNLTIYQYVKDEETVEILSSITRIKSRSFYNRKNLQIVTCESISSVQYIESSSFEGCTQLTSIPEFPSIVQIDDYAFSNAKLLMTFSFGSSLKSVKSFAFSNCANIKSVSFSSNIPLELGESCFDSCALINTITFDCTSDINLGKNCFSGLKSLKSITIPNNVKSVGEGCFSNSGLQSVIFSDDFSSFNDIPASMFSGCSSLVTIDVPRNIVNLGLACFEGTNISSIVINDYVESIGDYCFRNCFNLEKVTIGDSSHLSSIGFGAFDGCIRFKTISKFTSSHFVVDSVALFNIERTSMIVYPPASPAHFFYIPSGVTSISSSAFTGCVFLESVLIPDNSVTVIGRRAFYGCTNLRSINIPLCVRTIGEEAFLGCRKLTCGIIFENKSREYRKQLISSGLPSRSLNDCALQTCRVRVQNSYHFMIYVLILL